MPEKTLSLPLAGDEIIEAIVDKIRIRLSKDGFLNSNLAYDYFDGVIHIKITAHDCGRKADVEVKEALTLGEPPQDENALLDQAEAEFEIEQQSPNEVRVETGQGVPVLGKDADGRTEIKKVKYGRNRTAKSAK